MCLSDNIRSCAYMVRMRAYMVRMPIPEIYLYGDNVYTVEVTQRMSLYDDMMRVWVFLALFRIRYACEYSSICFISNTCLLDVFVIGGSNRI